MNLRRGQNWLDRRGSNNYFTKLRRRQVAFLLYYLIFFEINFPAPAFIFGYSDLLCGKPFYLILHSMGSFWCKIYFHTMIFSRTTVHTVCIIISVLWTHQRWSIVRSAQRCRRCILGLIFSASLKLESLNLTRIPSPNSLKILKWNSAESASTRFQFHCFDIFNDKTLHYRHLDMFSGLLKFTQKNLFYQQTKTVVCMSTVVLSDIWKTELCVKSTFQPPVNL